jgi:hypothetical protein
VVDKWLDLVQAKFDIVSTSPSTTETKPICIATHCVAGLGRYVSFDVN